jgi:hypothetical protein
MGSALIVSSPGITVYETMIVDESGPVWRVFGGFSASPRRQ